MMKMEKKILMKTVNMMTKKTCSEMMNTLMTSMKMAQEMNLFQRRELQKVKEKKDLREETAIRIERLA